MLHGEVTAIECVVEVYDTTTGRATSMLITVRMKVWLVDQQTKKEIYRNDNFVFRQPYAISTSVRISSTSRIPRWTDCAGISRPRSWRQSWRTSDAAAVLMSGATVGQLLERVDFGKSVPGVLLLGGDTYLRDLCRKKIVEAYVEEAAANGRLRDFPPKRIPRIPLWDRRRCCRCWRRARSCSGLN